MRQVTDYKLFVIHFILLFLYALPHLASAQTIHLNIENNEVYKNKDTAYINQLILTSDQLIKSNPDSALILLQEAFNYSLPIRFTKGILSSLLKTGNIYRDKSFNPEALKVYNMALHYCDSFEGTQKYLASVYSNLGSLFNRSGDLKKAVNYYYIAAGYTDKYPSITSKEEIYINLSIAYERMGKPKLAFHYSNLAEKKVRQKKDYSTLMSLLNNKGVLYIETGKDDSAAAAFKEILKLAKPSSNSEIVLMALNNLGDINIRQNQPERAYAYLKEAQGRNNFENPYITAALMMSLGEVYYSQKKYDLSARIMEQVIPQAQLLHIPDLEMTAHQKLSDLYEKTKKNGFALRHFKEYVRLKDSISGKEVALNLNELEVKYKTAEMDKAILNKQFLIAKQQKILDQKSLWITGISSCALIILILSVIIHRNFKHKQSIRFHKLEINYLKNMMLTEDNERTRIARELHDGIGGMLGAVRMNLGALKKAHPDFAGNPKLEDIADMLQETAVDVRKTAHNLMPDMLMKNNLKEALTKYCDRINDNNELLLDIQFNFGEVKLGKTIELMIYRIIQELIQNIMKHANASKASIQIMHIDKKLSLLVEDNGKGFELDHQNSGTGIQNLKSRVKSFDGSLSVFSSIGKGTTVHIQFDWEKLKQKNFSPITSKLF